MQGTFEFDFNRNHWFVRFGRFELMLEAQPAPAPEGFLSFADRGGKGEIVLNIGRLTVYLVNQHRANLYFLSRQPLGNPGAALLGGPVAAE